MLRINDVTCLFSRLACLAGLLVFPIVGCSDLDSGAGGTGGGGNGGAAATGGAGGVGGAAGTGGTVPLFVTVFESDRILPPGPGVLEPALEGVEICEVGTNNCVTSNDTGKAVLDLPINQEIAITIRKDGYNSWVLGDVTDDTFRGTAEWEMYPEAQLMALADQLGIEYPWTGGMVGLLRWPSPDAGVTFTPVGATIDAVGDAFYFNAETEQYGTGLEATTDFPQLWRFPLGEGGFAEVTAGEHEFELGGTAGDCPLTSWGWPGSTPNKIRVPVMEGHMTYGSLYCDGTNPLD